MTEEKVIATAPVTEGDVTITIAEYRGLIEAAEQHKAAAAIGDVEKNKLWWEAYNAQQALANERKTVKELQEQIAALKTAGGDMCDFIASSECIKAEFKLFLAERHLERKAAEAESGAEYESATE